MILLQEIYGSENFPTTIKVKDLYKYRPDKTLKYVCYNQVNYTHVSVCINIFVIYGENSNFDIVTDENGYSYYMIPEDTLLYRGDTTLYPLSGS